MTAVHRITGFAIVAGLFALFAAGVGLRIAGRDEAPVWYWVLQRWMENLLGVTAGLGILLFVVGRRLAGGDLAFLHYFYGSLFPLIAIVVGRIAGLRRAERGAREYVGLTWGAFFAFGLTMRALTMGLGIGV